VFGGKPDAHQPAARDLVSLDGNDQICCASN
jgi:hypothetical protein